MPSSATDAELPAPRILVHSETAARASLPLAPEVGWSLLALVGTVFLVVGLTDLGLAWIPARIGNADWEFGTVSRTYENLPLTTLGLALLLGAAAARGSRWLLVIVSIVCLLVAAGLLFAGVLYASNIPLALRTVTDPVPRSGLKRALVKGAVQGTLYPLVFFIIGVRGLRHAATARAGVA